MKFVAEDKGKLFLGVNDEHAWRVLGFEEHPVVVLRDLDTGDEKKLDYADDWPYLRLEPKRQYRKGEKPAPDEARKTIPTDPGDEDLVLTALGELEDKGMVPSPVVAPNATTAPDFDRTFGPDKPEHKPVGSLMDRIEANSESIRLCTKMFPNAGVTHLSEIEEKLTATQRAALYRAMSEEGV